MRLALVALALPALAHGSTIELSHGIDALSGGRPGWRATALEAVWTGGRGAAVGAAARELSRFDQDDVELAAFGQAQLGGLVLALEGSASPSSRFLPRWSAGARAERRLGAGWVASAGARAASYEGDAATATPLFGSAGLERYWGRWRAAGAGTAVALEGAWSGSGRLAVDVFYGDGGRAGISAAAGRELESLGDGRLLRTDVVAGAVGGAHPLRGAWAVVWELSAQRQGKLYTRTGGRLGLLWLQLQDGIRGAPPSRLASLGEAVGARALAYRRLRAKDPVGRLLALRTLGYLRRPEDRAEVVRWLDDPRPYLSLAAARALVRMDPDRSPDELLPRLCARADWPVALLEGILRGAHRGRLSARFRALHRSLSAPDLVRVLPLAPLLGSSTTSSPGSWILRETPRSWPRVAQECPLHGLDRSGPRHARLSARTCRTMSRA